MSSKAQASPPVVAARSPGGYERFVKPVLDRVMAAGFLLIASPLLALIALAVRIRLGAPVIVSSERVGRNGEVFGLRRFRTAPTHLADTDGTLSPTDPRASRLGRFLGRTSLDELPQLWNVLRGEMSMVGPRPERPSVVKEFEPWQHERHRVKPGITGPWQVSARGDGRVLRDYVQIDIEYIDHMSLANDVAILLMTMMVIVLRHEKGEDRGSSQRHREVSPQALAVGDSVLWGAAIAFSVYLRPFEYWAGISDTWLLLAVVSAAAAQLAWGFGTGLYRGRYRLGSLAEVAWLATGVILIASLLFWLPFRVSPGVVPRSAMIAAGSYMLLAAMGMRFVLSHVIQSQRVSPHSRSHRLLIFGAGEAGQQVARALQQNSETDLLPVAFLDDDPRLHGSRAAGLPILGDRHLIRGAARRYGADTLLVAVPSAGQSVLIDVADLATQAGLGVRVLPPVTELVDRDVGTRDIREITLADFLSREEIRLDLDEIAGYLRGKKVLVTGAGGSIGSVLCEVVARFGPAELMKLDHDENALHALELRMEGRAVLDSRNLILADIRDRDAMMRIMRERRPDVVFHTAAHKHVTFLESHPHEAFKTNVVGTLNVLEAVAAAGVGRFVNVSTDKAADPVNVLGSTKRLGEMLTAEFARRSDSVFMSVRFGNVLGSKGSVIPTFTQQIERGEAMTVTNAEVTRYFMTIEEAVQLVVQAGAVGGDGHVHVLDMGDPVKIVDLARRLSAVLRPGQPPRIVFTGLRPGEKLHEILAAEDEVLLGRPHELLFEYGVPPIDPTLVRDLGSISDPSHLKIELEALVVTCAGTSERLIPAEGDGSL